jgi:putative NADH-flavin reductase
MKIFIVGATGRSGTWILKAALDRGHHLTALVRPPMDRIGVSHPALRVVSGDLFEPDSLREALTGHDAIVSTLNSDVADTGTLKLISLAEDASINRFIAIAGGGILQLDADRLRCNRPNYPEKFRQSSERHLLAWKALEASSLDWTLVCTPDLRDAPSSGNAKSLSDYMPEGGNTVALGDVADFVMEELERPKFLRKRVGFTE